MTHFRGIFPAVVTPFDSEGRLATASFERLIQRLDGHGVHGVYVCGSTGEGMLQTVAQRKRIAEVAVKCLPADKAVLVHVGAHRLEDATELASHASQIGARGISSLPPHGDYTFAEILDYYRLLASASDLPLFVYHLPELYPAISRLDQLLELCALKNVIGLKLTAVDSVHRLRTQEAGRRCLERPRRPFRGRHAAWRGWGYRQLLQPHPRPVPSGLSLRRDRAME